MIDSKSSAQSLVDIATQQNPEGGCNTMPPWRAGLLMGVLVIELLSDIVVELRTANAKPRRKAGEP